VSHRKSCRLEASRRHRSKPPGPTPSGYGPGPRPLWQEGANPVPDPSGAGPAGPAAGQQQATAPHSSLKTSCRGRGGRFELLARSLVRRRPRCGPRAGRAFPRALPAGTGSAGGGSGTRRAPQPQLQGKPAAGVGAADSSYRRGVWSGVGRAAGPRRGVPPPGVAPRRPGQQWVGHQTCT
jgi:hypothetical protein